MATPIAALLFDFDGTLWDCEALVYQAYDEYFQQHGQRIAPNVWTTMLGRFDLAPWWYLEELTGVPVDRDSATEAVRHRLLALLAGGRARSGVHRFLDHADGLGLRRAIVSNSRHEWIVRYAAQCGLQRGWAHIECADGDPARAKPDPHLYRAALTRLGLRADQVIAFEDSPSGVRAAKLAGIRCVALSGPLTAPADFTEADACITDFGDEAYALLTDFGVPVQQVSR